MLANAVQLASLADETLEGCSLIVLAVEQYIENNAINGAKETRLQFKQSQETLSSGWPSLVESSQNW